MKGVCWNGRLGGLLQRTLDWDSGEVSSTRGSVTDLMCDLRQGTLPPSGPLCVFTPWVSLICLS